MLAARGKDGNVYFHNDIGGAAVDDAASLNDLVGDAARTSIEAGAAAAILENMRPLRTKA